MSASIDWHAVREDFPLLHREVHGKPLVYFDSANTSQKPLSVIEAVDRYYRTHNANVSRAVHQIGSESTELYEGARKRLARHLNVSDKELVLTSGTTFAINIVAYSWALPRLHKNDVILLTQMEHHANIVPWQIIAERTGAQIQAVDLLPDGTLDLDDLKRKLTAQVKLLAFTHVSNVLGTVNPVEWICREAKRHDIPVLIDGSQALPHQHVDIQQIGCDFYVFTGHKMCGPTGTGGLWAKKQHLDAMPPFIGGGEMIKYVSLTHSSFNEPPYRFEAGTPNIAGFAGLTAAVDYLDALGMTAIHAREQELLAHLTDSLTAEPGVTIYGQAPEKAAVVSFTVEGAHAHDLATLLDLQGVAIRSGQHCAHPLLEYLGITAACRASLAFYNTHEEIDYFIQVLRKVRILLQ